MTLNPQQDKWLPEEEEKEDDAYSLYELESGQQTPNPANTSDSDSLIRGTTAESAKPSARWLTTGVPKPAGLRRYVWTFGLVTAVALLYEYYLVLFATAAHSGAPSGPYATRYGAGRSWPGWTGVENVFIFGDSWTTTGFEIEGSQPSRDNPMGNPEYAAPTNTERLGAGSNWVAFFTGLHNASFVETVNLAYGGATVDMELIHPFDEIPPGMRPLKYQVQDQFIPSYASESPLVEWKSNSTLFAFWIGLNDIHNATPQTSLLFDIVFKEFAQFVDELYQRGARNFLFVNIPPIQRSPLALQIDTVEPWGSWVTAWNQNLTTLASNLTSTYADSTAVTFDTFKLFNTVMDDPCSHPETCAFKETTTFCSMYAFGTEHWNTSKEECPHRIDEYLWMNDLHPTTRMHNLTALMMAEALT